MVLHSSLARALVAIGTGAALCVAGTAQAQNSNAPGGMQSGVHTAPASAAASGTPSAAEGGDFDPKMLFATTCGWCHNSGGRTAGKGPKLMDTSLSDAELTYRIKNGKTGQMPAFGQQLNDAQIAKVVAYIRGLKPE
jgi:mono/diheme cytochrome c family protein